MANTQPATRRLMGGTVQPSGVGLEPSKALRTTGVYIFSDDLFEIGTFVADNMGYITVPIGPYTYRMWQIALVAPAAIAGETDLRGGYNVVKSAFLSKYIDDIQIEINGTVKWHVKMAELVAVNAYHNLDVTEGVVKIQFGGPNLHNNDLPEDAYQFGTGGLRSVKLKMKTKAAWVTGMRPEIGAEYFPAVRPLGYFVTTTRYQYTSPGAGLFSISDIASGIDFSTMYIQAANVTEVSLNIDRRDVFSSHMWQLRALHESWGKDVGALGANGIMLDAFRDGDSIGYDSVSNSIVERARNADVKLNLTMTAAGQVDVLVFHCGIFSQQ